jgi:putative membrane protein
MTPRRVVVAGTAAGVLSQIPYPLVHGGARDTLTVVSVLVVTAAVLAHAVVSRGPGYAAALLAVAGVGGFAVEVLGVHTGFPFGDYGYADRLGPMVAGVPLVVGAAWVMMAHPAHCVARAVSRDRRAQVVIGAVALAGWDVFLDPQMVAAGQWRWAAPDPHLPGVPDVPLSNYAGWVVVSLVVAAVLVVVDRRRDAGASDDVPMLALWGWVWLSSTLANLTFFGRPAVAAWGFSAMGTALLGRLRVARTRPLAAPVG